MLIDLHAHTSGISRCCRIPAPEVLCRAKEVGLDGIVLTNHYTKSYIGDGDVQTFAEDYIREYRYAAEVGAEIGCKVFFGIEVTMELYRNVHMLVYGVTEDFLYAHPELYDYPQDKLYRAVKAHGGVLVQAHPFRNGTQVLDTNFLDGIEINSHPIYKKSYQNELIGIAERTGLILTSGGDYHADTYRPYCGTYLPDTVQNSVDVGRFLETTAEIRLRIHEPHAENYEEYVYNRTKNSAMEEKYDK